MKKIIAVLSSVLLLIISIVCFIFISKGTSKDMNNGTYKGIPVYNYTNIDRSLSLSDFANIDIGMNYNNVIKIIGEPNGMLGSGMLWPYYQLEDNSIMILYFDSDENGNLTELFDISITDIKGRVFQLKQDN